MFDDIYFSAEDGRAETKHVFLDHNNLPQRFLETERFTICETGFGTGLNFLMAWEAFQRSNATGTLHFISFEKYPLNKRDIDAALSPYFSQDILNRFLVGYAQTCEGFYETHYDERRIKLTIYFGDMNEQIQDVEERVDAWFLDGFAPAKNPDMWSETLFEHMASLSGEGTTCSTFTAAGIVKRGLIQAGFDVEKVRGFGRKRDMLRGLYNRHCERT